MGRRSRQKKGPPPAGPAAAPARDDVTDLRVYQALRNGNVAKLKALLAGCPQVAHRNVWFPNHKDSPAFDLPEDVHDMHILGLAAPRLKLTTVLPPMTHPWPVLLAACLQANDSLIEALLSAGADVHSTAGDWNAATLSCCLQLPLDALLKRLSMLKRYGFQAFNKAINKTVGDSIDLAAVHVSATATCFALHVLEAGRQLSAQLPEVITPAIHPELLRKLALMAFNSGGRLVDVINSMLAFGWSKAQASSATASSFCEICNGPGADEVQLVQQLCTLLPHLGTEQLHQSLEPASSLDDCPWERLLPAAALLHPQLLELILRRPDFDPNECQDLAGQPLLYLAVLSYNNTSAALETIDLLLHYGANPERPAISSPPQLCLPIMQAARMGYQEVVLRLAAVSPLGIPPPMSAATMAKVMAMDLAELTDLILQSVEAGAAGVRGAMRLLKCMRYRVETINDVLALSPLLCSPHRSIHLLLIALAKGVAEVRDAPGASVVMPRTNNHVSSQIAMERFHAVIHAAPDHPFVYVLVSLLDEALELVVHDAPLLSKFLASYTQLSMPNALATYAQDIARASQDLQFLPKLAHCAFGETDWLNVSSLLQLCLDAPTKVLEVARRSDRGCNLVGDVCRMLKDGCYHTTLVELHHQWPQQVSIRLLLEMVLVEPQFRAPVLAAVLQQPACLPAVAAATASLHQTTTDCGKAAFNPASSKQDWAEVCHWLHLLLPNDIVRHPANPEARPAHGLQILWQVCSCSVVPAARQLLVAFGQVPGKVCEGEVVRRLLSTGTSQRVHNRRAYEQQVLQTLQAASAFVGLADGLRPLMQRQLEPNAVSSLPTAHKQGAEKGGSDVTPLQGRRPSDDAACIGKDQCSSTAAASTTPSLKDPPASFLHLAPAESTLESTADHSMLPPPTAHLTDSNEFDVVDPAPVAGLPSSPTASSSMAGAAEAFKQPSFASPAPKGSPATSLSQPCCSSLTGHQTPADATPCAMACPVGLPASDRLAPMCTSPAPVGPKSAASGLPCAISPPSKPDVQPEQAPAADTAALMIKGWMSTVRSIKSQESLCQPSASLAAQLVGLQSPAAVKPSPQSQPSSLSSNGPLLQATPSAPQSPAGLLHTSSPPITVAAAQAAPGQALPASGACARASIPAPRPFPFQASCGSPTISQPVHPNSSSSAASLLQASILSSMASAPCISPPTSHVTPVQVSAPLPGSVPTADAAGADQITRVARFVSSPINASCQPGTSDDSFYELSPQQAVEDMLQLQQHLLHRQHQHEQNAHILCTSALSSTSSSLRSTAAARHTVLAADSCPGVTSVHGPSLTPEHSEYLLSGSLQPCASPVPPNRSHESSRHPASEEHSAVSAPPSPPFSVSARQQEQLPSAAALHDHHAVRMGLMHQAFDAAWCKLQSFKYDLVHNVLHGDQNRLLLLEQVAIQLADGSAGPTGMQGASEVDDSALAALLPRCTDFGQAEWDCANEWAGLLCDVKRYAVIFETVQQAGARSIAALHAASQSPDRGQAATVAASPSCSPQQPLRDSALLGHAAGTSAAQEARHSWHSLEEWSGLPTSYSAPAVLDGQSCKQDEPDADNGSVVSLSSEEQGEWLDLLVDEFFCRPGSRSDLWTALVLRLQARLKHMGSDHVTCSTPDHHQAASRCYMLMDQLNFMLQTRLALLSGPSALLWSPFSSRQDSMPSPARAVSAGSLDPGNTRDHSCTSSCTASRSAWTDCPQRCPSASCSDSSGLFGWSGPNCDHPPAGGRADILILDHGRVAAAAESVGQAPQPNVRQHPGLVHAFTSSCELVGPRLQEAAPPAFAESQACTYPRASAAAAPGASTAQLWAVHLAAISVPGRQLAGRCMVNVIAYAAKQLYADLKDVLEEQRVLLQQHPNGLLEIPGHLQQRAAPLLRKAVHVAAMLRDSCGEVQSVVAAARHIIDRSLAVAQAFGALRDSSQDLLRCGVCQLLMKQCCQELYAAVLQLDGLDGVQLRAMQALEEDVRAYSHCQATPTSAAADTWIGLLNMLQEHLHHRQDISS